MKKINFKNIKEKKGFTLLFAILVSVMVLAVGASIINISLKQVILSSSGRESQFAFYAANTGMECALYWDLNGVIVDENTGNASYVFPPPGQEGLRRTEGNFDCAQTNILTGNSINAQSQTYTQPLQYNSSLNTSVFRIAISNDVADVDTVLYCAEVTVKKELDNTDDSNPNAIVTTITSQGLNTCDPDTDARAVQRGLVLQYRS